MDTPADLVLSETAGAIRKQLADYLAHKDGRGKLTPNEADEYSKRAAEILLFIDKCDMRLVKVDDARLNPAFTTATIAKITDVIKAFVSTLTRPKHIADHFPCEELANRIFESK